MVNYLILTCLFAQGGIIKYRIRRKILYQKFAFTNGLQVFEYVQADQELSTAAATPAGIGTGTVFDITRRTFVFVSEEEVAGFRWCTSPFFESKGAKGGATVPRKELMFCFRPEPNPKVSIVRCQPADLGFSPTGEGEMTSEPYCAATLNLVANKETGLFTGQWRAMSCACAACQYGRPGQLCTSRGKGFQPLPWESYTVARGPAVPRKGVSFIAAMVDAALMKLDVESDFVAFARSTGEFIRTKLHRFRSVKAATDYVHKRAVNNQSGNWVEQAVLVAEGRMQLEQLHKKVTNLGWAPVYGTSWDGFVLGCSRRVQDN